MRVTMRTTFTGFRNGEPWPAAGESIDVPDHEAVDLIANGYAKEATDEDPAEHDDPTPAVDDGTQADADDAGEAVPGPDPTDEGAAPDELTAIEVELGATAELVAAGDADLGVQVVNLDDLDRDQLLAYADEHGIDVNRRLGEAKLRNAIASAPLPPVVSN